MQLQIAFALAVSRSFITPNSNEASVAIFFRISFTKIVSQLSASPCARVFFVAFAERSITRSRCRQFTQQIHPHTHTHTHTHTHQPSHSLISNEHNYRTNRASSRASLDYYVSACNFSGFPGALDQATKLFTTCVPQRTMKQNQRVKLQPQPESALITNFQRTGTQKQPCITCVRQRGTVPYSGLLRHGHRN